LDRDDVALGVIVRALSPLVDANTMASDVGHVTCSGGRRKEVRGQFGMRSRLPTGLRLGGDEGNFFLRSAV
jgi:hypothetical protein